MSQFLVHLTKDGSFRIYEPFSANPAHYLFKGGPTIEAKDSLKKILQQQSILARTPFGHFQFQIPVGHHKRGMMPLEWLQSVCFSETPISELKSFYLSTQDKSIRMNKYKKYGLAFSQSLVRQKGGHPIFYFDSNNPRIVEAINKIRHPANRADTKSILGLFEPFGSNLHSSLRGSTDYRWEREWRHTGNFNFNYSEVSFGLCPEREITEMETLILQAFPFIDPDWDQEKIKSSFLSKGFEVLATLI